MQVTAIIAAAGDGRRVASDVPKQFIEIGGVSLLQRSLNAFCRVDRVTQIVVVTRPDAVDAVAGDDLDPRQSDECRAGGATPAGVGGSGVRSGGRGRGICDGP